MKHYKKRFFVGYIIIDENNNYKGNGYCVVTTNYKGILDLKDLAEDIAKGELELKKQSAALTSVSILEDATPILHRLLNFFR